MNKGRLEVNTLGIAVIFALALIIAYIIAYFFPIPVYYALPVLVIVMLFFQNPCYEVDSEIPDQFSNTWVTLEAHNAEDLKIKPVSDGKYFEISGRSKMYPSKSLIRLNLHLTENVQHIMIMQSDYATKKTLDRSTDEEGWFKLKVKKFPNTTKVVFGENETVIWEA